MEVTWEYGPISDSVSWVNTYQLVILVIQDCSDRKWCSVWLVQPPHKTNAPNTSTCSFATPYSLQIFILGFKHFSIRCKILNVTCEFVIEMTSLNRGNTNDVNTQTNQDFTFHHTTTGIPFLLANRSTNLTIMTVASPITHSTMGFHCGRSDATRNFQKNLLTSATHWRTFENHRVTKIFCWFLVASAIVDWPVVKC